MAEAPLAVVPTTEQLIDLEREIQRLLERKRRADLNIIDLEARIHAVETSFLRETAYFGTIMNGLDGYLAAVGASTPARRSVRDIRESDRLLSQTSASQSRALAVHSRLVRERALNPIPIKGSSAEKRVTSSSGTSSAPSASNRKRSRINDPAWTTPRRNR